MLLGTRCKMCIDHLPFKTGLLIAMLDQKSVSSRWKLSLLPAPSNNNNVPLLLFWSLLVHLGRSAITTGMKSGWKSASLQVWDAKELRHVPTICHAVFSLSGTWYGTIPDQLPHASTPFSGGKSPRERHSQRIPWQVQTQNKHGMSWLLFSFFLARYVFVIALLLDFRCSKTMMLPCWAFFFPLGRVFLFTLGRGPHVR